MTSPYLLRRVRSKEEVMAQRRPGTEREVRASGNADSRCGEGREQAQDTPAPEGDRKE